MGKLKIIIEETIHRGVAGSEEPVKYDEAKMKMS